MIVRAVRVTQASSSTTAILLLVASNLVPLVGVLFWRWNVTTILVLYWVENGIVGVLNIPKMLLASGRGPAESPGFAIAGASDGGIAGRVGLVVFFLFHYGVFWLVHGVFVLTLSSFAALDHGSLPLLQDPTPIGSDGYPVLLSNASAGPDLAAVGLSAVGLAISHVASFLINFVGRREYRKVSPARQMAAPYARVVVLHLTILFGAFLSLILGSPVGTIVVLVLLKTILDLGLHVREHRGLAARPDTA